MGTVINSYGMDRCAAAAAIKLAENKMVKIKNQCKGIQDRTGVSEKTESVKAESVTTESLRLQCFYFFFLVRPMPCEVRVQPRVSGI